MATINDFFTLTHRDRIAIVTLDVPGETMNVLNQALINVFPQLLQTLDEDKSLLGVVFCSGKNNGFIAGADVRMLDRCERREDAEAISKTGHALFAELESFRAPTVAAIHGACLGGGLELALACDYRVCSDDGSTALGLPEVQLGLLPGSGGTQRLPRLIGIQRAMDMMLSGKQLRAGQAGRAGLVDDVVLNTILTEAAIKQLDKGKRKPGKPKLNLAGKLLEGNPLGRKLLFRIARKKTIAKTRGNYPAPGMIIDCIRDGYDCDETVAYRNEASRFAELVMSPQSQQLRNIFFATTEMKKEVNVDGKKPVPVKKASVLGGGLMGGGIAYVTINKGGIPVRLKDISQEGISHALRYSYDLLNKKVRRRFMSKSELQRQMASLTGTVDYRGFKNVDLVVEAVFEDLELKQQMVRDIEEYCHEKTVFATNTSSIPIGKIAAKAKRPENVVGLHYFSPVDKMPLVEIIPHEKTSTETIATTAAFARKQGKTSIVVKDAAGFYINRILAPYINEAAYLLLAGAPVETLDEALVNFGFPVGPMTLLDEVGIDIGAKVGGILQAELGDRFKQPAALEKLLADKRLGKKTQRGFYRYDKRGKKGRKTVDRTVYELLNIKTRSDWEPDRIAHCCVFPLLNEAVRCLDEGIILQARDGDIGSIYGIGFPPFLGGPYRYMDSLGLDKVVQELNKLAASKGERFKPCDALLRMNEQKHRFYS